jgi:NAD(P)-dependent dehydrogenase (short-subunit alcohol dehydrogenase family)
MLTRFTSRDENKATLVSTVPVKRLAAPEEIAHLIAFVASANASYMTGASIPVDGDDRKLGYKDASIRDREGLS